MVQENSVSSYHTMVLQRVAAKQDVNLQHHWSAINLKGDGVKTMLVA